MGLERQPILLILSLNVTVEFDYPVSSLLAVDEKFYLWTWKTLGRDMKLKYSRNKSTVGNWTTDTGNKMCETDRVFFTLYLHEGKEVKKMRNLICSHMYSYSIWSLSPTSWLSENVEKQSKIVLLQVNLYVRLYYIISIKNIKEAKKNTFTSEMEQTQITKISNEGGSLFLTTDLTEIKRIIRNSMNNVMPIN